MEYGYELRDGDLSGRARQPPRRSSFEMLLNVDGPQGWLRGHRDMDARLQERLAGRPTRGAGIPIEPPLDEEQRRLDQRAYAVRVLLASGDFIRQIKVTQPLAIAQTVRVESHDQTMGSETFRAPLPEDLEEAIHQVREDMKGAAALKDEMEAQADAMELFNLLDWDLHKVPAQEIKRGRFNATLQVVDTVLNVLDLPVHYVKHVLNVPRPSALGAPRPHIDEPRHASFPSGHAAAATALAHVLGELTGADNAQVIRLKAVATRIGKNRERAGLHTQLDTTAGVTLGNAMATWMVGRATARDAAYPSWCVMFAQASAEWRP